jgi:hypothetical protein
MFASQQATMDQIITWDNTSTRTSYRTTTIGEPLQASKQATVDHLRRNLHEHNTEKRQQENLCKQASKQPTNQPTNKQRVDHLGRHLHEQNAEQKLENQQLSKQQEQLRQFV